MIFASMYYFPVSGTLLKPLHNRHEVIEAAHTGLPHDEAGVPAKMASANAMVPRPSASGLRAICRERSGC